MLFTDQVAFVCLHVRQTVAKQTFAVELKVSPCKNLLCVCRLNIKCKKVLDAYTFQSRMVLELISIAPQSLSNSITILGWKHGRRQGMAGGVTWPPLTRQIFLFWPLKVQNLGFWPPLEFKICPWPTLKIFLAAPMAGKYSLSFFLTNIMGGSSLLTSSKFRT